MCGKHLQLGVLHLFGAFVGRLQDLPCLIGNCNMRDPMKFSGETPQKIEFKALLLAFATARVALSHVDLATFGLVQPISIAS